MRPSLRRFQTVGGIVAFAVLCTAIFAAQYFRVDGAIVIVTNTNDNGPGSLRQALADAQNGDIIEFNLGPNGETITLTSGELVINKSITINGPGSNLLTITELFVPEFSYRIVHVMPNHTVTIAGLTISGGYAIGSLGGGILNDYSTLNINNCTISGNHTDFEGAGIYNNGSQGTATLTIHNSTISGNIASSNESESVNGGGIVNDGSFGGHATLTIVDSLVTGNIAERDATPTLLYSGGLGGGIYNRDATLSITDSIVSNNRAGVPETFGVGAGGGIFSFGPATIVNSTINNNEAPYGGGIANGGSMTIADSKINNNSSNGHFGSTFYGSGGGVDNVDTLTIIKSTLSGNVALKNGGAVSGDDSFGSTSIISSTISDNEGGFGGGGVYGAATITNSTITRNIAGQGGGIYGRGVIHHSTFVDNRNAILATGSLELGHTILQTATANIVNQGGIVISTGYNISNDNGGGFLTGPGDQINTNPMLGPLQDNGGPTFTHDLLPGSPAIDAGDPNFTPPPSTEQRGYPRTHNGRVDVGSVEVQPVPTPTPTPTPPTSGPATHFEVLAPSTVLDVLPFDFQVTAKDQFNVTATGYYGTVHFSSTDPSGELPPDSTLSNGIGTFTARLSGGITGGYQTITANDTRDVSIVGTSNPIFVIPEKQQTPTPTPGRSLNLSTRMLVQTGDQIGIGGFIITGTGTKQVLLRAIGPSLGSKLGVANPLADPIMECHGSNGFATLTNDNWRDTQEIEIKATGIPPSNDLESAILVTLQPGAYTAVVRGKNDTTGVGLVEVYDLGAANSLLANISTRAFVGTADDVVIAGFIQGDGFFSQIFIRGVGPSLSAFDVPNVLADPTLELRDSNGALLAENDNCNIGPPLGPPDPLEACIYNYSPPGAYTAILAGKNGGTGNGLVEIYNAQ